MHKLWVVLKVSMTRPWVWLMLFFGACQLFPLVLFTLARDGFEQKSAFPVFDRQIAEAPQIQDLQQLARDRKLGSVEVFSTRNFPGLATLNEAGGLVADPNFQPRLIKVGNQQVQLGVEKDQWPVLDQLPQLKALYMQPPNSMSPEGWMRLGHLSQLEELTLADLGVIDQEAMKTTPEDLYAALAKLAKLRQVNLQNTCGFCDWELPPLPMLEYVILHGNRKLENSLETLAKHSPNLHTIALSTYPDFVFSERMVAAIRQMPNLQRVYVSCRMKPDGDDETQRQVQFLRSHLPGIVVYRGEFSMRRLLICGSLLILSFFLSFVVWFQSGLTLAQPLAAVLPGHRGPHIFWPAITSLLFIIAFVTGAVFEGAKLPPALGLAFMASTLAAAGLPGYDIRQGWRLITKLVSTVDVLCLFTLIGMGAASRATVDWFLLGDYPALAYLLMFWFLFAAIWKIVRATRLHLILAESGMTGIPGLNLGMQHMYDQPYKPAPGWSMASWQFNRMENAVDRRISGMDRMSWADKLRAGLPLNWGVWIGILMVAIVVLIPRLMTGVRPNRSSPEGMPYVLGTMQAAMMMLMMNAQVWVSRRGSIAADFLRPVSREKFWSALRMAIFHDLKPGILFGLAGGLLASYFANKGAISPLSILNTIVSGIGCYAFLHAWVVKLVISKRLAWDVTLAVVTSAVIVGMSIGSVILTFGERATPLIAILLSLGVLVSGGLMQRDLARQLPDWELG